MAHNDELALGKLPLAEKEKICSGIRAPRVITLTAGMRIYRFESSVVRPGRPIPDRGASPWWITFENYKKIVAEVKRSFQTHGADRLSLGFLGRVALAVRQEWSQVDILVKGMVNEDINVFTGLGATQYNEEMPNGMLITYKGWKHLEQLYLPNISDKSRFTPLGFRAITVLSSWKIESQQLF
jgi:hypothetical protein